MFGFLTAWFLLKVIKMLDVILEKENSSNGYYSMIGLSLMLLGLWRRRAVGSSSHQLKRIKCLLYYS